MRPLLACLPWPLDGRWGRTVYINGLIKGGKARLSTMHKILMSSKGGAIEGHLTRPVGFGANETRFFTRYHAGTL